MAGNLNHTDKRREKHGIKMAGNFLLPSLCFFGGWEEVATSLVCQNEKKGGGGSFNPELIGL